MKVAIVNAVYGNGSTGRTYRDLREQLVSRGHECVVAYGMDRKDCPGTQFMGSVLDHKLHALFARITGLYGCFSFRATRRLLAFLEQYRPDLVHLGDLHANYVNIPMLLKYLGERDIAVTVSLHDCYLYTGGCTYYTVNQCSGWQHGCLDCRFYKSQHSWFRDQSARLFRYKAEGFQKIRRLGVIGVSPWIAGEAEKAPVFSNAKEIVSICNWVDLEQFQPCGDRMKEKLSIAGRKMILGVAYRWEKRKGLDDFIAMAKQIPSDAVLVLVGRMDRNTSLPKNIISIPVTENVQKLAELYSAADVFVQFSREETFGKVLAEALACGTPAVSYRSTAAPLLLSEDCGICVPVDRGMAGILEAVKKILTRGKAAYSRFCRDRAVRCFNREVNSAQYLSFWEKIIAWNS